MYFDMVLSDNNRRFLVNTQVALFDTLSQETWHAAFPSLGNFSGVASLTQQEVFIFL